MIWLLACTEKEGNDRVHGEVTVGEHVAEMRTGSAYAAQLEGDILVALFPKDDVSCYFATQELLTGDVEWNPATVLEPEACFVTVRAPFEGELSVTGGTLLDATVSISCAMDPGDWEWREGTSEYDPGYYYSGMWWQGAPESFDLDLSGSSTDGYSLTLAMDTYTGQFIYDFEDPGQDPGTGAVSGTTRVKDCPDMKAAL